MKDLKIFNKVPTLCKGGKAVYLDPFTVLALLLFLHKILGKEMFHGNHKTDFHAPK
jgi:hypothetical protein